MTCFRKGGNKGGVWGLQHPQGNGRGRWLLLWGSRRRLPFCSQRGRRGSWQQEQWEPSSHQSQRANSRTLRPSRVEDGDLWGNPCPRSAGTIPGSLLPQDQMWFCLPLLQELPIQVGAGGILLFLRRTISMPIASSSCPQRQPSLPRKAYLRAA